MRLSPDRYPDHVCIYCAYCEVDHDDVKVDSIEGEDVVALCPDCGEAVYVRVIE